MWASAISKRNANRRLVDANFDGTAVRRAADEVFQHSVASTKRSVNV
jgi:hypothetical protein